MNVRKDAINKRKTDFEFTKRKKKRWNFPTLRLSLNSKRKAQNFKEDLLFVYYNCIFYFKTRSSIMLIKTI